MSVQASLPDGAKSEQSSLLHFETSIIDPRLSASYTELPNNQGYQFTIDNYDIYAGTNPVSFKAYITSGSDYSKTVDVDVNSGKFAVPADDFKAGANELKI